MKIGYLDFMEYLGKEEQNLLISINKFKDEMELLASLDKIYQEPVLRLEIPKERSMIPQLYLFVHFHLYFSVSCLLRPHLSESLSSTRKAIDASLSAYKIIVDPGTSVMYENRDKIFQNIKKHFSDEFKKNSDKYPLAISLAKIHEFCSRFGSHADIDSFFHRLEFSDVIGERKDQMTFHYFQLPRNLNEHKYYLILTFQAFYKMFEIFKLLFDKELRIIDMDWENTITRLGPQLDSLRRKYYQRIQDYFEEPDIN